MRWFVCAPRQARVLVVAAVLAASGVAATAAQPASAAAWDGGYEYVSPTEQRMAEIATVLTERNSQAYCNSSGQWAALGSTPDVLAFVSFYADSTASFMQVSPFVCSHLATFLAHPRRDGQKVCTRRVTQYVCPRYLETVISVETIGHEAMHIGGVRNEAVAECLALQVLPFVATRLGANIRFAYELARDYLPYYASKRTEFPEYWSSECRDGASLDLWPAQPGWPTPAFSIATQSPGVAKRLTTGLIR